MNRWFQKGNSRRFYRIDMPARIFLLPKTAIRDLEIYATGADYYPPSIKKSINFKRRDTKTWVTKIQEQRELVSLIFDEVIDTIDFLSDCIKSISKGESPKKHRELWFRLKNLRTGFDSISALEKPSPKTFQFFKLIETKFLIYVSSFLNSVAKSTATRFEADSQLPTGFKIDEILARFDGPKFSTIPLIQAIIALNQFLDTQMKVYKEIVDDNYLISHPDQWPEVTVNISSSGVALLLEKQFEQHDLLDVYIYYPKTTTTIHFEALVAGIRSIDDKYKERVALNFEYPNGKDQDYLQSEIELFEIKEILNTPVALEY